MDKKKSEKEKVSASNAVVATNRRARHDYNILDTYEYGVVLMGTEIRALREGKTSLNDASTTIDDGEMWPYGLHIPEYSYESWTNHSPRRSCKLLLHRKEIDTLWDKIHSGNNALIPLKLYFANDHLRIELTLARGKQDYGKRQDIKHRTEEREATRALGHRIKDIRG